MPLTTSRRVLGVLMILNWLGGFGILAMLLLSFWVAPMLSEAIFPQLKIGRAVLAGQQIMVLALLSVPITHVVLARLRAIVDTVGAGDPFVLVNAARLRVIAWLLVALEVLHLGVGLAAAAGSTADVPIDIGWRLSITRLLAMVLLFVLAQVFERGAAMREELEGTV